MTTPLVPQLTFRSWRSRDADALVKYGNNRRIWLNLKDRFPHPYTQDDAEQWIGFNHALVGSARHFAIDLGGQAVGSVGFDFREDVHSQTADLGFWVAEPFWGRGIATEAVAFIAPYAFKSFPSLQRLEAGVFEWNLASTRVLAKANFTLEARLSRAVIKDGRVGDLLLYTRLRDIESQIHP